MRNKIFFTAILISVILLSSCTKEDKVVDPTKETQPIEVNWTIKTTDNSHTVAIPTAINPTYKGKAISTGDVIGAYYESNGQKIIAGSTEWTGTSNIAVTLWGDDATSSVLDGLTPGELLKWVILIKAENKTYPAVVEYQSGTSSYQVNGTSILSKFKVD